MTGLDKAAGALAASTTPMLGKTEAFGGTGAAAPFSGIVHSILDQTQTLGKQAGEAVTGLLSGQGVEIHDVMIAQQKASVAFELALQVRNKAVSAYQQMMGMQF